MTAFPDPPPRPTLPASWLPWPGKAATQRSLTDLWTYMVGQTDATTYALLRLESRMTNAENAAYARAAEVVGLIRAEFASLRLQIQDAATAGAAALESDAQADADRITALVDELASVLPADVPDVPTPAPGDPAEIPTDPAA